MTTNTYSRSVKSEIIHSFFPLIQQLAGVSIYVRIQRLSCITLVDLDQVENHLEQKGAGLPKQVLTIAEQDYFSRFSYPKRRREWLGGRIAAKGAMLALAQTESLITDMRQLTILPDEHGRPLVETLSDALPVLPISISHSNRFAIGFAVKKGGCGVDLQKTSEKLTGLIDRFTTPQELDLLARQPVAREQVTELTMLWTAKEALKKSLLHDQPVIFSGIEAQGMERVQEHKYRFHCTVQGHPEQAVLVYNFAPYILSLTIADYA